MATAEVLLEMADLVRAGEIPAAAALGNAQSVPLAVDTAQLQLGAEIGRGTESVLRTAKCAGQDAVWKRVILRSTPDLDRFRHEVAVLATLRHPHVMPLLAARAVPPDYGLVLPRFECSLEEALHDRAWRPSWPEIVAVAVQLTAALQATHYAGILHRDVKPGNVLVAAAAAGGHLALSDYGLAVPVDARRTEARARSAPSGGFHRGRILGTLRYLAPEVLRSAGHTAASDVYALAVSLNEVATGLVPFSDCTKDNPACHTVLDASYSHMELMTAVAAEGLRPTLPPGAPAAWAVLMARCWDAAPSARPSCAEVLSSLHDMARLEGLQPPSHLRPPPRRDASAATDSPRRRTEQPPGSDAPVATSLPAAWEQEAGQLAAVGQAAPTFISGAYADAGLRGTDRMEDTHVVTGAPVAAAPRAHLVAVFDGHRGASAAQHAAAALPRYVREEWLEASGPEDVLARALRRVEAELLEEQAPLAKRHVSCPGAAALALLRVGRVLAVASVGDCRAVLGRRDEALPLTRDHSADDEVERARAVAAGAPVALGPDRHWRFGTAGLALARSLGDADAKAEGAVSGEPEVAVREVASDDDVVIVATDGLWDVVSDAEAVALVHDTVKNPAMAAKRLALEALARGSRDNVTVVVSFLRDTGTLESVYRDGAFKYGPVRAVAGGGLSRRAVLDALAVGVAGDEVEERL